MKRFLHSPQRGQSLVEFALIIPVFLLLTVMIFDFGRAVYYYSTIHNAAREGARYGVIHPNAFDYDDIRAATINYAIGLGLTNANVSVEPGTPENVGGFANPTIKVTVNYHFTPATPILAPFIPCQCGCTCRYIEFTSEAIMRTETLPSP
jgi:Flp pilus assembly protein TadG